MFHGYVTYTRTHSWFSRAEGNYDHGFKPLVDSLDEIVLAGNHYRLLEEQFGNLPVVAGKVLEVIKASEKCLRVSQSA